jgi:hypothetical protein
MHRPSLASSDQEQRLMKLIEGSAISHKQQVSMRSSALTRITERVAANIEVWS